MCELLGKQSAFLANEATKHSLQAEGVDFTLLYISTEAFVFKIFKSERINL